MITVPMELPIQAGEAASLAELIFAAAEGKALNDELRNRLAAQSASLALSTIRPYFGSLAGDPVHPSAYYLAIDARNNESVLLHFAAASAPTSVSTVTIPAGHRRGTNANPGVIINGGRRLYVKAPADLHSVQNIYTLHLRIGAL